MKTSLPYPPELPGQRLRALRHKLAGIIGDRDLLSLALAPATPGKVEIYERADVWAGEELALRKLQEENYDGISMEEERLLHAVAERELHPLARVSGGRFQDLPRPWTHFNQGKIRRNIEAALPSVGRLSVSTPDGGRLLHLGSGLIVGERLLMTPRHVAEVFVKAGSDGSGPGLMPGRRVILDFSGRVQPDPIETSLVTGVRMIHGVLDIALLELDSVPAGVEPLRLSTVKPGRLGGREIAIIGYPGRSNDRSPLAVDLEARCLGKDLGVKRIGPGTISGTEEVTSYGKAVIALACELSTVGTFGGAVILDVGTGHVLGMRFHKLFLGTSWAIPAYALACDAEVVAAGVNFAGKVPAPREMNLHLRQVLSAGANDLPREQIGPSAPVPYGDGEIAARLERLRAVTREQEDVVSLAVRLRHAAAVLAAFHPAALRAVGEDAPLREEETQAALQADILPNPYGADDSDPPWSLATAPRKRSLQEMTTAARMGEALAANPEMAEDIPIQGVLRRAIHMESFDLTQMEVDELTLLATVAEWLEGTEPGSALPRPSEILRLIESQRDRALLGRLASDTFMGRREEMAWIRGHLEGSVPELFFIAGQGGMGKSALISRALLDWEKPGESDFGKNQAGHLWVRVDMHHSLVDPEKPPSVLRQAARQMMRTHSAYSSLLTALVDRSEHRAVRQSQYDFESISAEDLDDQETEWKFLQICQLMLKDTGQTMLLWIDTFEEAQFLGNAVADGLIGMTARLTSALPRVRVLISGRALPHTLDGARKGNGGAGDTEGLEILSQEGPPLRALVLKELKLPVSTALLGRLVDRAAEVGGLASRPPASLIPKAAGILGGNPLTLRLAAPVLAAKGKADVAGLPAIAEEARQKYLMSRIVAHLHDAKLEKILLPSLELRIITPGVIRKVLAGPCGLSGMDAETARRLFLRLQRELTLVEPAVGSGEELHYRQDIRMILLRERKQELTGQDLLIHRNAAAWWGKKSGTAARAEELYHCLRLGEEVDRLDRLWSPEAGRALRTTLEELPEGSRQRLWLAGRLRVVLDAGESTGAAQADWELQAAAEVQRLLRERKPGEALEILARRADRVPGSQLYGLEARAHLFAGDGKRALESAWQGIAACRQDFKPVAVDLALLAGFISEREADFPSARDAVAEGVAISRQTGDPMLLLRAQLRARRLQRLSPSRGGKRADYLKPPTALLQAAREVPETQLRANPPVLREMAAELGVADPHYLRLAGELPLEEALASICSTELVQIMDQLDLIDPKEAKLLSAVGRQEELVKLARNRFEKQLHRPPSSALKPLYAALQDLFRGTVDAALHKDYAPYGPGNAGDVNTAALPPARTSGPVQTGPRGPRLAGDSLLFKQLVALVAKAPPDWTDTIVRHLLGDEISRLAYGRDAEATAREIVSRASDFGRIPELVEGIAVLADPGSKAYRLIRKAFEIWLAPEKKRSPASPPQSRSPGKNPRIPPTTMSTKPKKNIRPITMDDLQQLVLEGEITPQELGDYFIDLPPNPDTLEPSFMLNPERVVIPPEEATLESALLLNTANTLYSWLRKQAYEKKVRNGGPDLIRVIAEGDSWFQYPKILWDVIDKLSERDDIAIRCFSAAGDVLSNMVANPQFVEAIRSEKPKYFLLSGGGNDLVDGLGLRLLLKRYDPKLKPAQYLNEEYQAFKARVTRLYKDILTLIFRESPSIHVICHGYAYAIPDSKRGPWLGKPMEELGIKDRALQFSIMKIIVDDIQSAIKSGIDQATKGTSYKASFVDNRKIIPTEGTCWHDEFHPTDEYFAKVAEKIGKLIK